MMNQMCNTCYIKKVGGSLSFDNMCSPPRSLLLNIFNVIRFVLLVFFHDNEGIKLRASVCS